MVRISSSWDYEAVGISKSILSIISPGTHLVAEDDESARKLTRQCNEFAADLKRRYPDKFGFWASLPVPDVEGCLEEISYAMDTLEADGFAILTNAHGVYPGDASLDRVFAALNERKVTNQSVLVRCGCSTSEIQSTSTVPSSDSRVSIRRFARSDEHSSLRSSFPASSYQLHQHPLRRRIPASYRAGGCHLLHDLPRHCITAKEIKLLLQTRFWFDLAGMPFFDTILSFLRVAGTDRLLYGSDFPFTTAKIVKSLAQIVDKELPSLVEQSQAGEGILLSNGKSVLERLNIRSDLVVTLLRPIKPPECACLDISD